jgi:hypothetical protein
MEYNYMISVLSANINYNSGKLKEKSDLSAEDAGKALEKIKNTARLPLSSFIMNLISVRLAILGWKYYNINISADGSGG